jgi:hypothetical protein
MLKSNRARWAIVLCFALLAAGCGDDDSPTAPTTTEPDPDPDPVTVTGTWSGSFDGADISGDNVSVDLTQDGTTVTGRWTATVRLPPVPGAPPEVPLGGAVTGTVDNMSTELAFAIEGFADYFPEGCAIAVTASFDETTMKGDWMTNASCQEPAVDEGTLSFTR